LVVRYYYLTPVGSPADSAVVDSLLQKNDAFAKARAYSLSGDYVKALEAYKEARQSITEPSDAATVDLAIAQMTAQTGNKIQAVQLYKELIANPSYVGSPIARATAVTRMGELYYASLDRTITNEIFKDEPYKSFFNPEDIGISYRHLFEYSVFIHSLPMAELSIANWYAAHVLALSTEVKPDNEGIKNDMAIINSKLALAEEDIALYEKDPYAQVIIPSVLLQKALILSRLSFAGLGSPEAAEAAYKAAFAADDAYLSTTRGSDAFIRYRYARFLERTYQQKRAAEVIQTLAPLYTDESYKTSSIVTFFKNARTAGATKEYMLSLAAIDPGFKAYLISLGWTAADFK
jgi:hypothetical protein